MNIDDIHGKLKQNDLSYDIVDDAQVYMKNDPMFYRKEYFPAVSKMADMHRAGKKANPRDILMPMIDKGCIGYCKKYKVARHPDDIFHQEDRDLLFDKIYQEEMEQIEKGDYKWD